MRAIAAGAALISIVSLIATVALFGGRDQSVDVALVQDDEAAGITVAVVPTATTPPAVEPTVAPTSTVEPTPTVAPTPATAAVVALPSPDPSEVEPTAVPSLGRWCVGPRAIDVRLGPEDDAEVIGEIPAEVCDLDQLAEIQQGWMAVRSGVGVDLIEGWVWSTELSAAP